MKTCKCFFASVRQVLFFYAHRRAQAEARGRLNFERLADRLPTLTRLAREGASTLRARNQIPTWSQPNWATILSGQVPVQTGVLRLHSFFARRVRTMLVSSEDPEG